MELELSYVENLTASIRRSPFAVFAGAGISVGQPSSAPLWREILGASMTETFDVLLEANGQWQSRIPFGELAELCQECITLPEVFFEAARVILGTHRLESRLARILSNGRPNSCHRAIAALARTGLASHVVTTNFDPYIESAFREEGVNAILLPSAARTDHVPTTGQEAVLVKLHGSVEEPSTLTFTLNRSSQPLSVPLATAMHSALSGRNILICGYSGYDLDVFPVLESIVRENSEKGFQTWVNNVGSVGSWGPVRRLVEGGVAMPILMDGGILLGELAFDAQEPQVRPHLPAANILSNLTPFDCAFLSGWLLLESGKARQASRLFELCEDISSDNDDRSGIAVAKGGLAQCCLALGGDTAKLGAFHAGFSIDYVSNIDLRNLQERDDYWGWKSKFCQAVVRAKHPLIILETLDSGIHTKGIERGGWMELVRAEALTRKAELLLDLGYRPDDVGYIEEAIPTIVEWISFASERGLVKWELRCRELYAFVLERTASIEDAESQRSRIAEVEALCGIR